MFSSSFGVVCSLVNCRPLIVDRLIRPSSKLWFNIHRLLVPFFNLGFGMRWSKEKDRRFCLSRWDPSVIWAFFSSRHQAALSTSAPGTQPLQSAASFSPHHLYTVLDSYSFPRFYLPGLGSKQFTHSRSQRNRS